jgi:hypothetical protein
MKQHHWVIIGTEDKDGNIHFELDGDSSVFFPDGYIWDPETEDWERAIDDNSGEAEARDERIGTKLNALLRLQ